jgi:putative ABC transport system permease protein
VLGGVLATLLAGLAFALRPLAARPARILRAQD